MFGVRAATSFDSSLRLHINKEHYIQNIQNSGFIDELDAKYGKNNWIFQQDDASCHTSAAAYAWLRERCRVIDDWPANSPDLSPIEMLWAIMKRIVWKLKPKTIHDLKTALQAAWDLIRMSTINGLCRGFQARLEPCLEQEGYSISNLLGRLGEIKAMREFTQNATMVERTWTEEEDRLLQRAVVRFGMAWKKIKTYFESKNSNQLKNRWNVLKRRQMRMNDSEWLEYQMTLREQARATSFGEN
jgi:hypothetical protein